jgi:transaldolase
MTDMNARVQRLRQAGVSIWLDTLSRELLETGEFERLIDDLGITGATSNPTIFAKAITGSDRYDDQLRDLAQAGTTDPQALFFALGLDDIRGAADLLAPVYEQSGGSDGFVSFECTPDLADDTEATVEQALDLWRRLDRPNVMIKVPATAAGVRAIEDLTAHGVNVNVTLLFSVERYEEVIDAYLRGLERRTKRGQPLERIASVASFFVSRVDTKADHELAPDSRYGDGSRSPMPSVPTAGISSALATSGGEPWRRMARGRKGPCGRAQGPRIPPTPTSSTSSA